jgi:hypothetical protein
METYNGAKQKWNAWWPWVIGITAVSEGGNGFGVKPGRNGQALAYINCS